MASAITLKVGPITATRAFSDDVKVQEVLLKYAAPPDGLTNQEKVDYVLDRIVDDLLRQARRARMREIEQGAKGVATSEVAYE